MVSEKLFNDPFWLDVYMSQPLGRAKAENPYLRPNSLIRRARFFDLFDAGRPN